MSSPTPKKFAVVASQRTGSTLLIRSLDSSSDIFCAGELFHAGPGIHHPEFQFPYRLFGSRKLSRIVSSRVWPQRIDNHLLSFYAHASNSAKAVGFKLMVTHAQTFPTIMPFLQSNGVTLLYLFRDDTLATALSFYKAKHSGIFHSDKPRQATVPTDLTADVAEFEELLRVCSGDKLRIVELQRQFGGHLVSYEDMTANWDAFVAQTGNWLGLPHLRIHRILERVGAERESLHIVNEAELRERYGGHTK